MEESTHTMAVSCHRVLNVWALLWTSIFLVSSPSAVSCQPVTITSSISEGEIVCPGQAVTFECVTRGSSTISWISNEYVGQTIEFDTARPLSSTSRGSADPNTIATLINVTEEGSTVVLESQLQIIVSSVFLTPSVTCRHGLGMVGRFSFQVPGEPGVPQVTVVDYVMETCQLNISLADFMTNDTIQVFINGLYVDNVTSGDSVATPTISYVVSSCDFLNVSARIVDRCGRQGPSSSIMTFIPDQSTDPLSSTVPSTLSSTDGDSSTSSVFSPEVVAAIVVPITVLVITAVVVLVVVIVLCCYFNSTKNTPKRVSDIKLESKNDEEDTKFRET